MELHWLQAISIIVTIMVGVGVIVRPLIKSLNALVTVARDHPARLGNLEKVVGELAQATAELTHSVAKTDYSVQQHIRWEQEEKHPRLEEALAAVGEAVVNNSEELAVNAAEHKMILKHLGLGD
jgi:hypothetical protein